MPRFFFSTDEFASAADKVFAAAKAHAPASLLVADMDGFDRLADTYGQRIAQGAMSQVTEIASQTLRGEDMIVRAAGDRLLMLLDHSRAEDGLSVAHRLCAAARAHSYSGVERGTLPPVTLSMGVSAAPEHGATYSSLFSAADAARLRLKGQGKDGAEGAALAHHQPLHRALSVDYFAGRAQELRSLIRDLDEACDGTPGVVALVGEAGIGATSLLRQLEPEVRLRGGTFVMAGCSASEVREPYAPWITVIRTLQRMSHAPQQPWRELAALVHEVGTGDKPTRAHSQYRLLDEIAQYLRAVAADRPLMLALDDMQWADITGWDAFQHLVAQLRHERILICFVVRGAGSSQTEASEHRRVLAAHDGAREMVLSRLTRDEVKQWTEAAFHRQQVGREFLAFLYRHTEGNPLFISQLLYALVEDGALWHSESRWDWSPVSELRLPAGRSALISHRLSRFSASTQAVLRTAAAIGREFDSALIVDAGAGNEAAVRLAVTEALGASLIRPARDRRQGCFAFAHSQISEAILESMPRERRQELDGNVAQALERRRDPRASDIAIHYDRAGNAGGAFKFAVMAAAEVDRVFATGASNAFLHIAARNATTPAELADVRVSLAQLAETTGRYDEAEELCDLAIEWFEGHGDKRRALSLRRMRERARMELGQPVKTILDNLMTLSEEAQALEFDEERVAILAMASQAHNRLGDSRTAERIAGECVEMAERLGDANLLAEALNRRGIAIVQESPARAHALYDRALELFESTGHVRGQAFIHNNVGTAAHLEGRLTDAQQAWTMASTIARAAGILDVLGVAVLNLGVLAQRIGDFEHARERISEAIEVFASLKSSERQLLALYNMADVELEMRAWESALTLYETASTLAQRVGQSDVEVGSVASAGLCLLETGRNQEASEALREVEAKLLARPDWFQGRERVEALSARVGILQGRAPEVLARIEKALSLLEATEPYAAAWLMASCAEALQEHHRDWVRTTVKRLAPQVEDLGYAEMTHRYQVLSKL